MRVGVSCVVLAALLVPTLASADDHSADIKLALTIDTGGSKLTGFHVAFAKELPHEVMLGNLAPIADFSIQGGSGVTHLIYMGGLRGTIGKITNPNKFHMQFLVGGVYTDASIASGNDPAVAVSIAFERVLTRPQLAGGAYDRGWGVGVQFDEVKRFGDSDDTFERYSFGVVYRWPRR